MGVVFAVANQKGGVAKTTTTQALGVTWSAHGKRVLLVDADPQASLTYSMGVDPDALERSLYDVLVDKVPTEDVIVSTGGVDLLPATIDLASAEIQLMSRAGREYALSRALGPMAAAHDITLVDCPPSLGLLTINALTAADEVLVPMLCDTLSARGVTQLRDTIADVREYTNPRLVLRGVIATMYDSRTRLGRDVLDDMRERSGLDVLEPPVPRSVRVAEAPRRGRSIVQSAPTSPSAEAYRQLAHGLVGDR
jgi:chromosome partitioning protein